jgi:hypothetical protein
MKVVFLRRSSAQQQSTDVSVTSKSQHQTNVSNSTETCMVLYEKFVKISKWVSTHLFSRKAKSYKNPSTDKYLSPVSYEKVRILAPSGSSLIFLAMAAREAPLEMPISRPSSVAARRA